VTQSAVDARQPVLAIVLTLVLAGCASVDKRSASFRQTTEAQPRSATELAARIVQHRAGREATFVLGTDDPRPTPKTLASVTAKASGSPVVAGSSAHISPSPAVQSSPPRLVVSRMRQPVGAVYFAVAASRIEPPALPTVAAAAGSVTRADRVVLTAYTDPHGTPAENQRLAARRAEAVTTALAARGIDRAQVVVLSRPQCCSARPLPEREAAPYRRVDIEILTQRVVRAEERADGPEHGA
jgi:outer membrane protein OmpA-like peptidoglycan-associated protein